MKQPKFSLEDLQEIYYALETKLQAAVVQGRDKVSVEWRKHLRDIQSRIVQSGGGEI